MPYLVVPDHSHHAGLAHLRREALDVLAAGYRSSGRTLLGLLAWVLGTGGATVLAALPWYDAPALHTGVLAALGLLLVAGAVWLAAAVLRSGRRITDAAAQWLRVPAAGATDSDASLLLGVVRWRAVLAVAAAATAVALAVTLVYVLAQTGTPAGASLTTGPSLVTADTARALLVAALAVLSLATAGAAVGTMAGVRTVAEAAWRRPTVAAPQPAPAPPGTFAPRPTVDGPPTVALDLSALRAPAAEPADARTPAPTALEVEVLLPGGQVLRAGTTLVGRRPSARPDDVVDDVVVLSDQTVTKTHAAITVEGGTVRVVDRASTNGTLLEAPDGSLERCRAWQATTVHAPAVIHLGRTRLYVRPAAARRPLEVA
ncbi:FHA domain-containing protein [Georgenia wutianyii]|uniref:FHA domain-containing protein n=2 Tax=Georgenia TaxID=154116 RepID=A0ABX5VLZ4_9MICO|nr:FHA domain-containing protein [Georgenia wutianyii]QDB78913.1 FHA domain-containing protein [Georgenia wutianyii]